MDSDIAFFRREYQRQKRLEEIVNARALKRPKISKWQVATAFAILPFLLCACIWLCFAVAVALGWKILIGVALILLVLEGYLRFCLILTVKCYQRYAKVETRRTCKCIPSCSEYALLSLRTLFPLAVALWKIRKRLYRTCNGEEYKIDFPTKKRNKNYEKNL